MILRATGIVMAILSIALLYMGAQLVAVGGSAAYSVIALGVLATAVLVFLKKKSALTLYALLMWGILLWIIYEVGFDKWQWIPRGDLFALIGFWLAMPWVVRPLLRNQTGSSTRGFHPFLGSTVAVMALIVIALMFYDPYAVKGQIGSSAASRTTEVAGNEWVAYGGTQSGQRFSSLDQINPQTIDKLSVAWEYHTGDLRDADKDAGEYTFEATPLKVNNRVYVCTPHNEVHALNPESGKLDWKYTPEKTRSYLQQHQTCRGVSYYAVPTAQNAPAAQCEKRVIMATADARLVALDADTGKLCSDFGSNGVVDLHDNMGNVRPHALMQTAAPLVAGDLIVLGGSVMDNGYDQGNPSGVIRAYNVITGNLVWNFDPENPQNTAPVSAEQNYPQDTPVAWATLSADLKNGLVYVPFGNASPDETGTRRDPNSNTEKFRDALVALDLKTGAFKWKFQTSHNDLWDRDNPSQPSLLDLGKEGSKQPALLLPTKVGNIFVLNRLTGEPITPVDQARVQTGGGVPGERFAPTQPVSRLNFIPPPLTERSMWGVTPFDQMACRTTFNTLRYDGNPWTPATESGSLIYPGNIGVFNWGSVAVDPDRQILVATPVRLAYIYNLIKRPEQDQEKRLFTKDGKPYWNENFNGDYAIRISRLASGLGIPCTAPPWGSMVGVDLNTGKTEWKRRVGTTKNLKTSFMEDRFPVGFPMGMVAHGGPLLTAGGLIFHGATADNFIRAYDVNTGEVLWQYELPAGGQATPSTYTGSDGKQYVIISAGGHGSLGTTLGDSVMAFRLN
ncbi:membrane-bound PQQ-dependent dehydrogenase, glucose/quinate/shikimate family [Pseudomonas alliivorans]|uniref:Membrane-bound PQQ-dependent dehydrogenase, glucose/quinate/shikimate family n=1 Tax=Pseudomonas alliivorans TaxID=2810613 RepID=A0ABS4C2Q9_9PSED|nr:membrane-bound PQQ-dependent dehydrogenase, glucose/quinate/shikimate family [Pseudomonas alliivorans]MBP0944920.1 membrane-bound PQQ-dependent dehydrogenase, glucose/quinate/shikimate family [Pseudomonas alliivorans]MEE4324634.1 membrane-bound PQQ-dependent dehydrogenase, glucose/quinate/shikimate family [Pseudomonas alliivorans]MEE4333324.1 membrane-bound PQQ-dependent dehydrogenase, glucose/quinate/shikimate family [Pseudomonas alliivorans]MEE4366164.1 membrane-bound PQQ-dependent dehydro